MKKRMVILMVVFSISILLMAKVWGEDARKLSLEDAIKIGLASSPTMQISNIDLQKAVLQIKRAEASLFPTVSLSANATLKPGYQAQSISIPGVYTPTPVPPADTTFYSHSLDVNQTLFSEPIFKAYTIAKLYYGQEKYNWEKRREDMILNIVNTYLNALRAKATYQLALENKDQSVKYLSMTQAKFDLGLIAKADLLRMEVNLETAKNNLSKTEIAYKSSQLALQSMLGLDLSAPIELVDVNTPAFTDLPEPKAMTDEALKQRSDYLSGLILVRLSELNVSVNKGAYWPNLFLKGSYGVSAPGDANKLTFDNDKFSLTLSLAWTIWDGGKTSTAVKDAEYSLKQAQIRQDLSKKSIETELTQVYLNNIEIQQRLEINDRALALAKVSLRLAERSFAEGLKTLLELDDARIALQTAQLNYLQAKFDSITYDFTMRKARGVLDPNGLVIFDKANNK